MIFDSTCLNVFKPLRETIEYVFEVSLPDSAWADYGFKGLPDPMRRLATWLVDQPFFLERATPFRILKDTPSGWDICIVTGRKPNMWSITKKQVERLFPDRTVPVLLTSNKKQAFKRLAPAVFVDDSPKSLEQLEDIAPNLRLILLSYPYNEDVKENEWLVKVKDLDHALQQIGTWFGVERLQPVSISKTSIMIKKAG